jgi:hypothetical protein
MTPAFFIAGWLLGNVFLVGAFDIYACFFLGPEETVSFWIQRWLIRLPIMGVVLGIVVGHLAWPLTPTAIAKEVLRGNGGNSGT